MWSRTKKNHGNKVAGPSRDSPLTFKQLFSEVSSNWKNVWKKSLNGHATVVGGHATVGRLSNNVFPTFQAIWENFEKIAEGHATVVGGNATIGRLSNNVFPTFQAIRNVFEKSRWTVTRQWSEVTRPSADCQSTLFWRFKRFGKILKKVAERSRDSGWGHATVGRLSNNVFPTFQAIWENFEKIAEGHATVVGCHATIGRLSNNVFPSFQAIRNVFEKSRWTVKRQWSEVTRPSADCQTTFLDVSSEWNFFWKSHWTVTWQWSEVTRLSTYCQTTFFGRFKQLEFFWKMSLNGHATVVGGHATVGRLSNNFFWTFQAIWENFQSSRWTVTRQWLRSRDRRPTVNQRFWTFHAIWENFEKSRWTVTQQWSEVTRPSADCQKTFFRRFKQLEKLLKKVAERSRDSDRRSRDRRPIVKTTFFGRFKQL